MSNDALMVIGAFLLIVGIAGIVGLLIVRLIRYLQSSYRTADSLVAGSSTSVMVAVLPNIAEGDVITVEGREFEVLSVSRDGCTLTCELHERGKKR